MKNPSERNKIKLQELKSKKIQLEKEYSELVKSKIEDEKTYINLYDMAIELDNIEDEIKKLEKTKCFDDDAR